jgi:HD-GYP domain-containing protein (c-di-GMP phosphodiesterase class II)
VNPIVQFLTALGQAFAAITLYGDEHPMRLAAMMRLIASIEATLADGVPVRLSFIDGDVIAGARPLSELRGWDWGNRLSAGGIQRIEIGAPAPSATDVDAMLTEMRARMAAPAGSPRQWECGTIRLGPLTVAGARETGTALAEPTNVPVVPEGLTPELDAATFVLRRVADGYAVPIPEVDTVVHAMSLAVRHDDALVLPLFSPRRLDEYPQTHACNVSMLAIGLSDALGLSDADARAIGAAAFLHDIGNVKLPKRLFTKTGDLTKADRALIATHPREGARILSATGAGHALAATVAYEHHIWFNGRGGYPEFAFPRTTHYASRMVHICDIYDALCSRRPHRPAWSRDEALNLVKTLAGLELDPSIAATFIRMVSAASPVSGIVADAA